MLKRLPIVSRVTEDVLHNREGSVRFFISNIFEMAFIHYITSLTRQKKVYFVTSYLDSVHFYVLIQQCSVKKIPFDSPPWFIVSNNWPHCLVVHVQLWSSRHPKGPSVFRNVCLRSLIIFVFCRIPSLVEHVPVWSSQDALWPQK